MFGIGPMLPVMPAAENIESSSKKKVRKRKQKHRPGAGTYELTPVGRPSTTNTARTLVEKRDDYAVKSPGRTVHHHRDLSLTVNWTQDDLTRMASQLYKEVISDLDLSLFAYWIKAKNHNYLIAKEFVRELALDQGYNIDRIPNARVRNLLREVYDVRPRSVPRTNSSPNVTATDGSRHDRRKSLTHVLTSVAAQSKVWLAAIGETGKTASNKLNPRDPQHTSTWKSPFQDQTYLSNARDNSRAVSSPLTARIDVLPPSLRLERERAVQEAAKATSVSTDSADYPPNTPDRPAPLSVKSRGSRASNVTPAPNTVLRSVSTPIRTLPKEDSGPLPRIRAGAMISDTETLSDVSSSATRELVRSTADVFGVTHGQDGSHNNPFTDRLHSSEDRRHGTNERCTYTDAGDRPYLGHFQLDASDVASESSYETSNSLVRRNKDRANSGLVYDSGLMGDDSFNALESYVGSEDEDERSLLESASTLSEEEDQTQYQYAGQAPCSDTVIAGPTPTSSQRRVVAQARRRSQIPNPASLAVNFHRPLPLRSYESEATMFPTASAQANPDRHRAKSVTSIIASTRFTTEAMPLPLPPPLSGASHAHDNPIDSYKRDYVRDESHTKISEHIERCVARISQRSSSASTLAAFPIPSMENPVGELPMLVSRATSPPQALHAAHSQRQVASASLEETYRAITKVHMAELLQRTRARGEQLQIIEWDKLSSFERAWREMNELLLVTIYGRKDVALSDNDVEYIDCITSELRSNSDESSIDDWVRHIFDGEA